ncbi:MAG: ATP-binding cassette domain-containing protein [Christensenellales bacterium]
MIKAQNACFSPGQIYGIVGQNGCGKTVLFKCMSGLMPTTSGRIEIQLDDPAQKARPYCGVVIDGAGFNDSLSGLSNLVALADITKKADKKAIVSLMTSVGLSPDNRKKCGIIPWACASGWRLPKRLWKIPRFCSSMNR